MDFILNNLVTIIFVTTVLVLLSAIIFMGYLIRKCTNISDDHKYESELYKDDKPNEFTDDYQEMLSRWDEPQKGR